jgi:hypothetical protein
MEVGGPPTLTLETAIQVNQRVSLRRRAEVIGCAQGHCLFVRVIVQSRQATILRLAAFHSQE